jgi:hypothetical protein
MQIPIPMSLLIVVTMKFCSVTVMSPLVHINSCDLLLYLLLVTETSTVEEESSEAENLDHKTSNVWCETKQ